MSTPASNTDFFNTTPASVPVPKPVDQPVPKPVDPPVDPPVDDECPPEPCEIFPVPMNVEIQPDITICVGKPKITLKNKAVCICTPCKEKTK